VSLTMLSNNLKKSVRSLHMRKFRQKYNKFLVEGPKSCLEVINTLPSAIETLICTQEWYDKNAKLLGNIAIAIAETDDLSELTLLDHNASVMLIYTGDSYLNTSYSDDWSIYLDDVQDPGNVGTILRLADWYGLKTVYHSQHSAKRDNPKVIQSSMGAFIRVRSEVIDQAKFIAEFNKPLYIADLKGIDISEIKNPEPGVIVIGNEGNGINKIFKAAHQTIVTIPGKGQAESLNASISCGIILSHFC